MTFRCSSGFLSSSLLPSHDLQKPSPTPSASILPSLLDSSSASGQITLTGVWSLSLPSAVIGDIRDDHDLVRRPTGTRVTRIFIICNCLPCSDFVPPPTGNAAAVPVPAAATASPATYTDRRQDNVSSLCFVPLRSLLHSLVYMVPFKSPSLISSYYIVGYFLLISKNN